MALLRITYVFDAADAAVFTDFLARLQEDASVTDIVSDEPTLTVSFSTPV